MENIISPSVYISALSGLNSMLFVKKFGIIQPQILDRRLDDIQAEINERYKSKLGFGIYEVTTPEEILRFGNLINDEYSEITRKDILNYNVSGEIKLLKNAKKVDNDFFKEKKILFDHPFTKELLRVHKLTSPNLNVIIRNPIEIFSYNEIAIKEKLYFTKTPISYRNHSHWLVAIIFESELEKFECNYFFILKEKKYQRFNTIRLFLSFLNDFCGISTFKGVKSKLILYEQSFIKNKEGDISPVDINSPSEKGFHTIAIGRNKYYGQDFVLWLVVNTEKYNKELLSF